MQANLEDDKRASETTSRRHGHHGQILVMFAAGLLLLIGMVALAVDAGFIMAERRQVQSAADAGAMAAAKAKLDYLYEADINTVQQQTGKRYGAANAETVEDDVMVDPDPDMEGFDDVYVDGVNRYVEVTVSKDVESFFLRALYDGDWGVSAEAIAGVEPVQRPYALLALGCGPGGQPGIQIDGGGTIDVNEGSIMSNCGIGRSGQSNVVTADGAIDAHGEIDAGDQWSAGEGINEHRPEVSDPIAQQGIDPPSRSDAQAVRSVTTEDELEAVSPELVRQGSNKYRCEDGDTCALQPGYYGGNLSITAQNGTLFFEPGVYYFGNDFTMQGQSDQARFEGDDVLLYFDDNSFFNPDHSQLDLSAPATSPYAGGLDGMLLWIDEDNCFDFTMKANGRFNLDGVFYAPCSDVELYGSPNAVGFQVVVNSVSLDGGNGFDILYEEYVQTDTPHVFLVQ